MWPYPYTYIIWDNVSDNDAHILARRARHSRARLTVQRDCVVLLDGLGCIHPAAIYDGGSAERTATLVVVHPALDHLAKLGEQLLRGGGGGGGRERRSRDCIEVTPC